MRSSTLRPSPVHRKSGGAWHFPSQCASSTATVAPWLPVTQPVPASHGRGGGWDKEDARETRRTIASWHRWRMGSHCERKETRGWWWMVGTAAERGNSTSQQCTPPWSALLRQRLRCIGREGCRGGRAVGVNGVQERPFQTPTLFLLLQRLMYNDLQCSALCPSVTLTHRVWPLIWKHTVALRL